ncbi:MAG: tripartite tricarboxylate transporter TctB family protein [Desulfobacteraceae bacterium]|nr:MAG: tripartite tricarboxylate transporter TctB family protein [Desulfobacteraceae bacterium]
MKKADIGVGVGLIILSGWIFWYASTYRQATIYYYGPNFFPQILSIAMSVCAIILILKAFQGRTLPKTESIYLRGFARMLIAIAICIGYLFLMQVIGFAMGTGVFLFVLMMFIGQKGLLKRVTSSVVVSLIVWAIFRYFLVIPLPTGMFEFTF